MSFKITKENKMDKDYYPTYYLGCNTIHPVMDWSYVRKFIRAAKKGDNIPPILIEGSSGNGNLLAGTHRAAANDIMAMLDFDEDIMIPIVSIDDFDKIPEELQAAIENNDYEEIDRLWDRYQIYETMNL
jgi:hypothetical protein